VCAWTANGISTKLLNYRKDVTTVTPPHFAKSALARCTSGVFAGTLKHEVIEFFLMATADLMPMKRTMKMFQGFFGRRALKKKREMDKEKKAAAAAQKSQ